MYKLFDYLFAKNDKTEIKIKVTHYELAELGDSYSNSSNWLCSTEDEFKKIYDQIEKESKKARSKLPEIYLNIELSGKLKGVEVKEKFNDLDSYRLYLENNSLFKSSINCVNNSSVNLSKNC